MQPGHSTWWTNHASRLRSTPRALFCWRLQGFCIQQGEVNLARHLQQDVAVLKNNNKNIFFFIWKSLLNKSTKRKQGQSDDGSSEINWMDQAKSTDFICAYRETTKNLPYQTNKQNVRQKQRNFLKVTKIIPNENNCG